MRHLLLLLCLLAPTLRAQLPHYHQALPAPLATALDHLWQRMLFAGAVPPETKLAMGHTIARHYAHKDLAALIARYLPTPPPASPATAYALALTRDIHGVSPAQFAALRQHFNDAQLVELTTTTAFFNFLVRVSSGLSLSPPALSPLPIPSNDYRAPEARVALLPAEAIGPLSPNSMRAMYLHPSGAQAWREFWAASRQFDTLGRTLKLHISFAVSMANGCRYCTLHQVAGLRRQGLTPARLLALRQDDSQLSPRELAAVTSARKLTRTPTQVTRADYDQLREFFGDAGALEVILQTATFAYMNRFTDGLHLPSEDEAIHTYEEVYGPGAYAAFPPAP